MQKSRVVTLTGIYPPDSGGPATFAVSFSEFTCKFPFFSKVISLTDAKSKTVLEQNRTIKLISRRGGVQIRTSKVMFEIFLEFLRKSHIIANGFFVETYLVSLLFRSNYVAKVPGDIVWERAVNSRVTVSDLTDFQRERLPWKYRLFRILFSKSLIRAKAVIVPSRILYELCLSWGVPKENIHLIFNSIDVELFQPASEQIYKYDCIVVNRLVKLKNVDQVILACHAKNLSLLVVGDGPEMESLTSLSNKLNAVVTFAGNATREKLLEYLHSAKIFILNSTVDATSYSLLEARSCGLIAIANIETGASEVIQHKVDGFLTDSTSHLEVEYALEWVLSRSPNEILEIRQNSRKSTMEHFNTSINFAKILEIMLG